MGNTIITLKHTVFCILRYNLYMKKIRIGMEILSFLAGKFRPVDAECITQYLNDTYDTKEIKKRTVLEYLREISKEYSFKEGGATFPTIKSIRGKYGGWIITKSGREKIKQFAMSAFDVHTLNAINDSLERAMISETFYYKKDLSKAKGILYAKKNFHTPDHEHYVGNGNEIVKSELIKKIKSAMINDHYTKFTFKFIRYSVQEKEMILKPIRLIHDLDESFLVCTKRGEFEPLYINVRNIKTVQETEETFRRRYEPKFNKTLNKKKTSIAVRKEQWANIKVLDERVYEVINLWVHGCEFDIDKKNNLVKVKSSEHYKIMLFLFRMIGIAEIIDAHPMVLKNWKEKVRNIK